jgi:hemoglobin
MYEKIGGSQVIDQLVDDFYDIMATDPQAKDCFATHQGLDIHVSAEKLKAFLSGWTGGPQIYLEKYGHPRLRMRHSPFMIGSKEGEQWLLCMRKALVRSSIHPFVQEELLQAFQNVVNMLTEHPDQRGHRRDP